jgi:hypothetical protein
MTAWNIRILFAAIVCAPAMIQPLAAEVPDASAADVSFFAGRWATGPADREGFETIYPKGPDCSKTVEIVKEGGAKIRRIVILRNGVRHEATFTVKRFGVNFPWWTDAGPAPVARRIDANTFILAATRVGKADWAGAIKHTRC